jgi:DHA2 family multidrug resistance protein
LRVWRRARTFIDPEDNLDVKPLIGLAGVVIGVSFSELNDQVVSIALPDISGDLGIGVDIGSWLRTVYLLGLIFGAITGPSLAVIFSQRRFLLGAIALACGASLLFPITGKLPLLYLSRVLQGVGQGFIISNLIAVALKVLPPPIRLYGLCFYALTATCIPSLATSLAAVWVDVVGDWRFIFLQAAPLASISALLIWYGMPQEPPRYDHLKGYDWLGAALAVIGFGSLIILLEEGELFDWFNSPLISVAALTGAVTLPVFLARELTAKAPLIGFFLLKRRNLAYPVIALTLFLVITVSSSQVPITFLQTVQGYRPLQSQTVTLEIALSQLLLLPATAWLLDFEWVDARVVSGIGLLCILVACGGGMLVSSAWNRDQFVALQTLQAVGLPLVIMPLLMMATNALVPQEGPLGSSLVNATRGLAEAMGAGLLTILSRWRGALHQVQILDVLGQNRINLAQLGHIPNAVLYSEPGGRGPGGTAMMALEREIRRQVSTLVTIDTYAAIALIVIVLMIILAIVPEYSPPPRIALAKKN